MSHSNRYKYRPTFYHDGDDGSGGFTEPDSTFDTPEEAFAFADEYVAKRMTEARERAISKAWFDKTYGKYPIVSFIVEVRRD